MGIQRYDSTMIKSDESGRFVFYADHQSELAALREELAKFEGEIVAAIPGVRFMDLPDGGSPTLGEQVRRMSEALTAAEQRNAELVDLLKQLRNVAHTKGGISLAAYIDPHLKPTESGASECSACEGWGKRIIGG